MNSYSDLDLLKYAIDCFVRQYVIGTTEDDSVPRPSLAQSTSEPRRPGIAFKLRDVQARLVAEGRVQIDSAGRRRLRWWLSGPVDTIPDLFVRIGQAQADIKRLDVN